MRFLLLSWFHLKIFAKNSYFINLAITGTLSLLFVEYIVAYVAQTPLTSQSWIRAAIFGLWSCGTTAAGSISFQRHRGTLPYLLNNKVSDEASLAAVVFPAASFGLLCFPLAMLAGAILRFPITLTGTFVLAVICLWVGALVLDFLIASIFVLTRHAMVYEDLLMLPLLLVSGLYNLPSSFLPIEHITNWLLPIALPIKWLIGTESLRIPSFVQFLICLVLTTSISHMVAHYLLTKAKQTGRLGVVL